MPNELASIIVFTYNQEGLIEDALNSARFQDYEPLELIICDDGSRDRTGEVCKEWIKSWGDSFYRVLYCRNETNLGTTRNIRKGIGLSAGSIIKLLGGDDLLAPAAIKNGARFLEESPDLVIFGNVIGFEWDGKSFQVLETEPRLHTRRLLSLPARKQFRILSSCSSIPAPAALYRRTFFEQVEPEGQDTVHVPDWPRWLKATSLGIPLVYRDFDAVYYRSHPHGHKDGAYREKCLRDVLGCIDKHIRMNGDMLSFLERMAVWANRKKHESLLTRSRLEARIYNGLLTLLKFFVRASLYLPRPSDKPARRRPGSEIELPFKLKIPS